MQTRDPRALGHGDIFDTYAYTGRTGHSWRSYLNGTLTTTSYPESRGGQRINPYDAAYVARAERLAGRLITSDGKLAAASGPGVAST